MPLGPELALGVAGGVAVCGVVGVVLAGVELVELVVLGEVLVAADAPVIPAAAPPAASAPATSVVPIIFEMRIFAPSCPFGDGAERSSWPLLLSARSGPA